MGVRLSALDTALTRAYPPAARFAGHIRRAVALDVAFDHLLYGLHERKVYEALDVTLKGGTALRKFYIGHRGRFSFDLDFDIGEGADDLIAEEIDGMAFPNFGFAVQERRGHYSIDVTTDLLPGGGGIKAKMDFSTRGLWLPARGRRLVRTPLHDAYSFDTGVAIPVVNLDENVAEKLGRWQRDPLIRDLYDLAVLSGRVSDPQLITKMWVLKRHAGMTGGGHRHVGPAASIAELTSRKEPIRFVLEDLVLPTDPAAGAKLNLIREYLDKVDRLCRIVERHMTPDLLRYADDRGALRWPVEQEIAAIKDIARRDILPG